MAWIKTVDVDEATGALRRLYDEAKRRAGKVFQIVRVQSVNPGVLRGGMGLYGAIMHAQSPLSRASREMIATVVSRVNDCYY